MVNEAGESPPVGTYSIAPPPPVQDWARLGRGQIFSLYLQAHIASSTDEAQLGGSMRRLIVRFGVLLALVSFAFMAPEPALAHSSTMVCGPFCVTGELQCSVATIQQWCPTLCPGSGGGICGEDQSLCPNGFKLVCGGGGGGDH